MSENLEQLGQYLVGPVLQELRELFGLMEAAQRVFIEMLRVAGNQRMRQFQSGLKLFFGSTWSSVMNSRFLRNQAMLTLGMLLAAQLAAEQSGPVAWWKFDERDGMIATDSVGGQQDQIAGNVKFVPGISGRALKFDGFTAYVTRNAQSAPRIANSFAIEAWIAIQEYPLNWVAVVDHERNQQAGYYFGLDSDGTLGLQAAIGGQWVSCTSDRELSLMQWHHVVGSYDEQNGIVLYLDGRSAGRLMPRGTFTPAIASPLRIGKNFQKLPPTHLVRPHVSFPASYSFDGIIDELKIYARTIGVDEAAQLYSANRSADTPPLVRRTWPAIPDGRPHFGAVYAKLKFYDEWDALWPVGPDADVVVGFDDAPYKMVFWRGTNYNANLVTENRIWVGDQSAESGTKYGCAEHMSDKQDRYSHVRLIENDNARVVVHWRYGLVDVTYQFANVDPETGWGEWADEYYYIYPDGVAIRNVRVWGKRSHYSVTEPTILNEPGKRAEDSISLSAITLANLKGETHTYSWDSWPTPVSPTGHAEAFDQPQAANVSVVNVKSKYRPFYIYPPGSEILPYGAPAELRPQFSHFPTWNHWPVDMAPSDGRYALAADRFSSSAITSPEPVWTSEPGPSQNTYFLIGLTSKPASELAAMGRSWLQAPNLVLSSDAFATQGYDRRQRAYMLARRRAAAERVDFVLEASESSPVLNPAIVIEGWGESDPVLAIDGKLMADRTDFRFGHVNRIEGTDLVLWVRHQSTRPVRFTIAR